MISLRVFTLFMSVMALSACQATSRVVKQPSSATPVSASTQGKSSPDEKLTLATDLPSLGLAPDFRNELWLNTDEPLTLEKLRGRVVLVEFWTFG